MPVRFQVDPDFYDHPKTTGMSDAAFSLWVRAGSFSAAKLTDGFISEDVLALTLRTERDVADELARRGLWRRVKGGYRFHEWDHRNLTKTRVEGDRKADRDRKRQRRGTGTQPAGQTENPQAEPPFVRTESERNPDGIRAESEEIPGGSVSVSVSASVSGSGQPAAPPPASPARLSQEPPTRCPRHLDDPHPPPCGSCAEQRKIQARWDTDRRARIAAAPQCRRHRGQPADNCAPCRSEALAPPTGAFPVIVRSSSAA
jgi:hypothetical protein